MSGDQELGKRQSKVHKVFISYSHKNEALREELEEHLAALKREGRIETWHDRRIAAGDEWRGQIDEHLEAADLILLLVSASFIASDYCWDVETTRALERHARGEARVVPVIVRACDLQGAPFAELQALPKDGEPVTEWTSRDKAWLNVAQGLRRALGELGGEQPVAPRYADEESRRLSGGWIPAAPNPNQDFSSAVADVTDLMEFEAAR